MMFSLMSFFLVVNLAVMMRELSDSQPMSAACASGANIRATPSVWRLPPRCVLSTAAVHQMKVSAVLIAMSCFECLICMCFVFLYWHLFSAIEHISHGKAL